MRRIVIIEDEILLVLGEKTGPTEMPWRTILSAGRMVPKNTLWSAYFLIVIRGMPCPKKIAGYRPAWSFYFS